MAFIVSPVRPKVCFISVEFSAIDILLCLIVWNEIISCYCFHKALSATPTAEP